MKRSTARALSILFSASAVAGGALAGCSSAPSEDTGAGHEAYTYEQNVSLNASSFNALVNTFVQPSSASFSATNNVATFTSSTAMQGLSFPPQVQVPIPLLPEPAGICGTATVSVPSLSLASPITVALGADGIDIDATVNGSALAQTSTFVCPNPTFTFSSVPVHATVSTSGGNLVVTNAQITLDGHTSSSCGLLGWCDGLASNYVGDAQNAINGLLQSTLSKLLAGAGVQSSIDNAVVSEEGTLFGLKGVAMVPGSLSIANGAIGNSLTYTGAPPTPSCNSAAAQGCISNDYTDGALTFTCTPIAPSDISNEAYTVLLQREVNGQFQTVQTIGADFTGTISDVYALASIPTGTSFTYRVCFQDTVGTSCGAPIALVTTMSASSCQPVFTGAGGGCPKGSTWNLAEGKCVAGCTTPACECRAAGGAWDGKTCE